MHNSEPNDQLIRGLNIDSACIECHREPRFTTHVAEHTHHAAQSAGNSCVNCHMPHTTYALFKAIRTHLIESPDFAASVKQGVPNACNLCHLDRTLAWTQEHLVEWYGYKHEELTPEQQQISAALLWMLEGHAAQRVIVAWHVGWRPALEASGSDWLAPFVARLLADPYGVVRYVAEHSLVELPGFDGYQYNFLASPDELSEAARGAVRKWQEQQTSPPSRTGADVLISSDGQLDEAAIEELLDNRDNRPVTIKE
jgi:hypothetical protein